MLNYHFMFSACDSFTKIYHMNKLCYDQNWSSAASEERAYANFYCMNIWSWKEEILKKGESYKLVLVNNKTTGIDKSMIKS